MCRRRRRGTGRFTGGLLATLIVASACSEPNADRAGSLPSEGRSTIDSGTSTAPASETTIELVDEDVPVSDGSVVSTYAGEEWFLGDVPALAVPADPTLEPIILGMINQEDPALGSYAEVRAAVEAAAAWVNAELGGVDGHPIEIRSCTVDFDPEQSRSCALEMVAEDVVALVGGVHVLSDVAAPILEQAGLVSIGGIPANLVEQRSRSAFFFSGGDAGALTGFMAHAAANGRTKVALAYAEEIESFQVAARDYGATVGESLGLDVELIPFSFFATDQTPVIERAQEVGADALIVLAATVACVPVVRAAADLGLDAQLYLTGACAGTSVVEAAGDAMVGVVFNSEGAVDGADVEGALYQAVIDRYADEPAGGAGTVGFRGFMNLYGLLLEVGADDATSLTLGERARSAVDRPSFWGHPYTCDGNQVPGLPALCAPQQLLFGLPAVGQPFAAVVTDWIPTDELLADALR
jgi:branched-chain amino acid transport system substrate-binding protein